MPLLARKKGQKRPASPLLGQLITGGEPEPPPVPFSTDMKNVEFELDGKQMRISVYDPIEVLSKVMGEIIVATYCFCFLIHCFLPFKTCYHEKIWLK